MGLNITEYIWNQHKDEISLMVRPMVKSVFDKMDSSIARSGLMFYYSTIGKKNKSMDPLDAAMIIKKQMDQLSAEQYPVKLVDEAWLVLRVFNNMRVKSRDWIKQNKDTELPYIFWEKCPWILSVALFLAKFRSEDYPQVPGWVDFFMWLPQTKVSEGKVGIDFRDYVYACGAGSFDSWYASHYGRSEADPSKTYRQLYKDELYYLDKESLTKEANRGHWGCNDVKEELRRRQKAEHGAKR